MAINLLSVLNHPLITNIEAQYLLDNNNYKHKASTEFKNAFINFRKSKINLISNLPFIILSKKITLISIP